MDREGVIRIVVNQRLTTGVGFRLGELAVKLDGYNLVGERMQNVVGIAIVQGSTQQRRIAIGSTGEAYLQTKVRLSRRRQIEGWRRVVRSGIGCQRHHTNPVYSLKHKPYVRQVIATLRQLALPGRNVRRIGIARLPGQAERGP